MIWETGCLESSQDSGFKNGEENAHNVGCSLQHVPLLSSLTMKERVFRASISHQPKNILPRSVLALLLLGEGGMIWFKKKKKFLILCSLSQGKDQMLLSCSSLKSWGRIISLLIYEMANLFLLKEEGRPGTTVWIHNNPSPYVIWFSATQEDLLCCSSQKRWFPLQTLRFKLKRRT